MKTFAQLKDDKSNPFMSAAIDMAKLSVQRGGGPFGCVIVKNGKIVGRGHNKVTMNNDPTAHAEVMAIRDACTNLGTFQLDDCEVYTSCYPCPMCLGAIYWARPKVVYYGATKEDAESIGFDDRFIYAQIEKPEESRKIPFHQVMGDQAAQVFHQDWKNKEDKIEY